MAEKPILFGDPMVRAILDGRKTQTRRIIKPQPPDDIDAQHGGEFRERAPYEIICNETGCIYGYGFENDDQVWKCPYEIGDVLWVRECWIPLWDSGAGFLTCLYPTGHENKPDVYKYRADGDKPHNFGANWRPSIHMPRKAARIFLRVTDVRCQRLQEISEEDAIAEGSQCAGVPASLTNRGAFAKLWESIYACKKCKGQGVVTAWTGSSSGSGVAIDSQDCPECSAGSKGYGWEANPWVWAITLERCEAMEVANAT